MSSLPSLLSSPFPIPPSHPISPQIQAEYSPPPFFQHPLPPRPHPQMRAVFQSTSADLREQLRRSDNGAAGAGVSSQVRGRGGGARCPSISLCIIPPQTAISPSPVAYAAYRVPVRQRTRAGRLGRLTAAAMDLQWAPRRPTPNRPVTAHHTSAPIGRWGESIRGLPRIGGAEKDNRACTGWEGGQRGPH